MELRQILEQLINSYLRGDLPLSAFEHDIVPYLPVALTVGADPEARDLMVCVDDLLVEIGLGEATESDLRQALAERAVNYGHARRPGTTATTR